MRSHQDPGEAITALARIHLKHGGLQGMQLIAVRQTFDGHYILTRHFANRQCAGVSKAAVNQHPAGATLLAAAAETGTVEFQLVSQCQ